MRPGEERPADIGFAEGGLPRIPVGIRVYAIGDIHGRADLLDELLWRIGEDAATEPEQEPWLIFVGDYVDRGPDSAGVIRRLISLKNGPRRITLLKGNHEDMMLRFVESGDPRVAFVWMENGGLETLASYGVDADGMLALGARLEDVRERFLAVLPVEHRGFLEDLGLHESVGDYLFVHAGLRPGRDIAEQSPADLMWIRRDFLDSRARFPAFVVHGHTPSEEPEVRENRMGIDTGAGFGRHLTAAALWRTERRFLQAGRPGPTRYFDE